MGVHVQEYMENLKEEDPERYAQVFRKFIEASHEDDLEDMYTEAHEAIRADPAFTKTPRANITHTRNGNNIKSSNGNEYVRKVKCSHQMRKSRVAQKWASA